MNRHSSAYSGVKDSQPGVVEMRELTDEEIAMVSGGMNWGAVYGSAAAGAIGGAVAGVVAGPVGLGAGAIGGAVGAGLCSIFVQLNAS